MSAKIALAGYMGSGKSTAAKILAEAGAQIIDADLEAKILMQSDSEIKKKIFLAFGESVFREGAIAFDKLGSRVFRYLEEIRKLNSIVHPPLLERLCELFKGTCGTVVLDAALIPLWKIESWFDQRIWISASFSTRLKLLMLKPGALPESDIMSRMKIQEKLFETPPEGSWRHVLNEDSIETLRSDLLAGVNFNG